MQHKCSNCGISNLQSTQELLAHNRRYPRGECHAQYGPAAGTGPAATAGRPTAGRRRTTAADAADGAAHAGLADDDLEEEADDDNAQRRVDRAIWSTLTALNDGRGASQRDRDALMDLCLLVHEVLASRKEPPCMPPDPHYQLIEASTLLLCCQEALKSGREARPSLTNGRLFQAFTDGVLDGARDNWTTVTITVDSSDVPALRDEVVSREFHHQNMSAWLDETFSNPTFRGHFALKFQQMMRGDGEAAKR